MLGRSPAGPARLGVPRSRRAVPDPTEVSGAAGAGPTAVTGHHLRALNGLRALAVVGVVAYHLGWGWASGGYLGVDLFFVLSGFLITSLLLEERVRNGALDLARFWARRAKRLLPALFLVVAALGLYLILNGRFGGAGANGSVELSNLRGDALATLLYVGNWHAIYADQSYFTQFSAPSPLAHTWSLAIEEQFYLLWPPVLLVLFALAGRAWRRVGLLIAVAGALGSAALMALLYHPGVDPTRIYYGTDTRLFDLMAGAALAFVVAARPQPGPRSVRTLHLVGPLAAVALAVFWATAGTPSGLPRGFMFEGGFLLCAVLAALVLADARLLEPGPMARALSLAPCTSSAPSPMGSTCGTGRSSSTSTAPAPASQSAPSTPCASPSPWRWPRPATTWSSGPSAGPTSRGASGPGSPPSPGSPPPWSSSSPPCPRWPTPPRWPRWPARCARAPGRSKWPARAATPGSAPSSFPGTFSPAQPLRATIIGDSVMGDASYGHQGVPCNPRVR